MVTASKSKSIHSEQNASTEIRHSLTITILADFNKDGLIDEPSSSVDETNRFAIILPIPNLLLSHLRDGQDITLMRGIRPLEIGTLKIRLNDSITNGSTLHMYVDENARDKVQLFCLSNTQWESLGSEGVWKLAWENSGKTEVTLGIVANSFVQPSTEKAHGWSGNFTLSAAILTQDGITVAEDKAPFRVAPFMLASALEPVEEVVIVRNVRTAQVVEALQSIIPQTGARLQAIEFADGTLPDVWIQDTIEIGAMCVPAPHGDQQAVAVLTGIRAEHDGINCAVLDRNIREYFGRSGAILVDAATPRKGTRWIDWYGNLEVSPPVRARNGREFPFGRILTGVQKELGLHPDVLAFLEAQRVQAPPLIVDTSWLTIGHVDEVVNFVPTYTSPGFRVLIPSIRLAKSILEDLASQGLGNQAIFANHKEETMVARLLNEVAMSEESKLIHNTLQETREHLCEGLGIDHDAFIEIPVLFQDGVSIIPNCVNGLICNGHAILPDPLGPQTNGEDAFAVPIRKALIQLGMKVHFVDIWESYHLQWGEIHCGTNAIRRIQKATWWNDAGSL